MFRSFTTSKALLLRSSSLTTNNVGRRLVPSPTSSWLSLSSFNNKGVIASSSFYSTGTLRTLLPIKAVEVFTLDGIETKGTLIEQVAVSGSYVEAGDVVAIVQTTATTNDGTSTKCEIYSPENGRLIQMIPNINDSVSIGDPIFTIDTDAVVSVNQEKNNNDTSSSSILDNDTQMFLEYIQANHGKIDDTFLQNFLTKDDNVQRIRSFAFMIRDKFPTYAPTSLRVFEYIKEKQLLTINEYEQQQEQHDNDAKAATIETKTKLYSDLALTHTDIGITYYRLGDLDNALINLERAREIRTEHMELNKNNSNSNVDLMIGTYIHIGTVKHRQNDIVGAIEEFTKVLELQKEYSNGTSNNNNNEQQQQQQMSSSIVATLNSIGAMKYQMNDYHGAMNHYKEAVSIQEKIYGTTNHPEIAGIYNNIGIALKHIGDTRGALEYCKKALTIRQETLGYKHQETAASHYSLAQMLSEIGEYDGSIEQYEYTLQIQKDSYGENSPIVASTMNNVGAVYYQQRNLDKALEYYTMALNILLQHQQQSSKLSKINNQRHIEEVASCYNNIGLAYYQKQEYDDSLKNHTEALTLLNSIDKDNDHNTNHHHHPTLAVTIGCIGNVLKSKGQYDEALTEYRKAHTMLETIYNGSNHPDVGSSYNNMGQALALQGKYNDSITVYKAARTIFRNTMGTDHPNTGSCSYNIGLSYKQMNDTNNAIIEFQDALRIWTPILGIDHPQTKIVQQYVTALLEKQQQQEQNEQQ